MTSCAPRSCALERAQDRRMAPRLPSERSLFASGASFGRGDLSSPDESELLGLGDRSWIDVASWLRLEPGQGSGSKPTKKKPSVQLLSAAGRGSRTGGFVRDCGPLLEA